MDFRFLGPLEVRSAGTPLPLGGHKQRGILAVLLLHANTVVSVDHLVEDVWGAEPPRTVQAYVQNCVSRLRTVLGREVIETHPSGYLLRVDPDNVDALRFARTVEAARALETPERVAALSEALALWRGTPLPEFAYEPFAQAEVGRLEELRLEALETRLGGELELGRHAAALPELEALAARHPSRERLRYLQMLALYRAGRQRDALAVYQAARRELVEVYGLEPGETLRALERMILSHDPALRARPQVAAQRLPPRSVVTLVVEPPFDDARAILQRRGGTVLAGRRDSVMVAFGIPHPNDDDALRALRAAGELQAAKTRTRVAIDRSATALDPALIDAAAPGETVLGPGVLPLVAHAVDVVALAGGGYRLLRLDEEAEALPRRFDTPFVGREAELQLLDAELAAAIESGSVRHLLVLGDAGIGKTRLAREFATRAGARVITCRFRPYDDSDALTALLAEIGSPEEALAGEHDAAKVAAAVNARPAGNESRWAFRRLVEATARETPVVLVLEDLQWATPDVFDLADYLVGWSQAAFLVLELGRPEVADTRRGAAPSTLYLDSLSTSETETLARALRDDVANEILDAADGNPLYVEQLVAWSREEHAERVPPTIDALIATRIQRLPKVERRALECASVAGVEFWRGAVEAVDPDAAPALMSLARRRLVHPGPSPVEGEDGFRFHHPLIRDVVYAAFAPEDRARAHAAVAHALGPAPEHDALAGQHLEQAALIDRTLAEEAGRRLGAAGLRALTRIDAPRATDLLERATRLVPEGPERRHLQWGFATAAKFGGDPGRADELLESVAARATAAGDELNVARARMEQIWPRLTRGTITVDDARELLERAAGLFGSAGDDFAHARALDLAAAVDGVYLLQVARAEATEHRARALYERSGSATGASDARLAGAAYTGPTPAGEAIRRCEAMLAAAETPVWASFVRPFLAVLHSMEGRFDVARAELETARTSRAEFADPATLATSWAFLVAEVEIRAGMLGRAEEVLAASCARLRALDGTEWLGVNLAKLGEVQAFQGRDREARASADEALAVLPPGHLTGYSVAMRVRATAYARTGDVEAGLAAAREIVDALEPTDALVERALALTALAVALEAAGLRGAVARRREARALFRQKGDRIGAARLTG